MLYLDLYKEGGDLILVGKQSKFYNAAEHSGICVVKRKNESDEELIRRFRKKFSKSGLAKEIREKMYYEKPSYRKRRKQAQSIRLIKKEEEKIQKLKERSIKFKKKQKRLAEKEKRKQKKLIDKEKRREK